MEQKILENVDNQAAIDYFKTAYLRLPRVIISRFSHKDQKERNIGLVHLVLFANCNYSETMIAAEGTCLNCRVGEWLTNYSRLISITGLDFRTIRYCIDQLKTDGFVTTTHIGRKTNFYVCGYEQFTTGDNSNCLSVNDASGRKQQHQRPWTCQPDYSHEQEATMRIVGEGVSHVELVDYSSCMKKEHYG